MKTPEEILKSKLTIETMRANNSDYTFYKVIEAMDEYAEQERVKSWNEAIETAAENANIEPVDVGEDDYFEVYFKVDKQSILKLKK